MKHPSLFAALPVALLLAACGTQTPAEQADLVGNPLYARYYYQDLMETMANYGIQRDRMLENKEKKGIVDATKKRAQEHLKLATDKVNAGKSGGFMSDTGYASGIALLHEGTIYFSQDFNTLPGPSIYVFASDIADPGAGTGSLSFPREGSLSLGPLQTPYGAQAYAIPAEGKDMAFRSVILWDNRLERLMGYAQLGQ